MLVIPPSFEALAINEEGQNRSDSLFMTVIVLRLSDAPIPRPVKVATKENRQNPDRR
jgi:hypothetical protein